MKAKFFVVAFAAVIAINAQSQWPVGVEFVADLSPADAQKIFDRMLEKNKPWLQPAPLQGHYSLGWNHFQADPKKAVVDVSPSDLLKVKSGSYGPIIVSKTSKWSHRVGAVISTPLQEIATGRVNYSIKPIGRVRWNELELVALDVHFPSHPAPKTAIGFSDGATMNVGSRIRGGHELRIFIDPKEDTLLLLQAVPAKRGQGGMEIRVKFDPDFLELDGGWAPRKITWTDNTELNTEGVQEFQIRHGYWLFKEGKVSYKPSGMYIRQSSEMTDFELGKYFEQEESPNLDSAIAPSK